MAEPVNVGAEVREALEATKPPPVTHRSPLRATVIIVLCIVALSMIANLALYQWGSDKSNQVESLSAESECRSEIAAATDVAQGQFLADLGDVQLATARGLAALGVDDDTGVAQLIVQLRTSSDELDATLAAYLTQLEARAATADTCTPGGNP